ncbi:hypothetical protein BH20CHL2_BH20CHL2_05440 [soil metagenome]
MTAQWPEQPGFMRSPNIATDADLYEIENLAADPDRTVDRAMQRIAPWSGKVVIDVGAGTGFHLDRFHDAAAHVIAVEPDPALRIRMMRRIADNRLERTSVIGASAVNIPLRDHCVDIVHSRFAYFFGPVASRASPRSNASSGLTAPPSSSTTTSAPARLRRGFTPATPTDHLILMRSNCSGPIRGSRSPGSIPAGASTIAMTWSGSSTSSSPPTRRLGSSPIIRPTKSSTTCC